MDVVRHRFTTEEYQKMGEAGILHEDDRVELIDGEVVEMTPIGWRHARCVMLLNRLLNRWAFSVEAPGGSAPLVMVQDPITLEPHGEPQPDLALVEGAPAGRLPVPAEVLLVVEVAGTSIQQDREVKLPLYSRAGIPEAWLVDLNAEAIEVRSEPGPEGYGRVARIKRGEWMVAATVTGLAFDAAEALSPREQMVNGRGAAPDNRSARIAFKDEVWRLARLIDSSDRIELLDAERLAWSGTSRTLPTATRSPDFARLEHEAGENGIG